jgi:hypothetical protein
MMPEVPAPQKPIPQYTIRGMLGVTTGCAVLFSIVALAMRGYHWALGISVAVGVLALFLIVCAALFVLVWIGSLLVASRPDRSRTGQSPFMESQKNDGPFRLAAAGTAAKISGDSQAGVPSADGGETA